MELPHERYAGFWPRLMAHNIDLLVLLPLFYLISFIITSTTYLFILCFLCISIYEIAFTSSSWSATPGKRMIKIMIVDKKFQPLTFQKSVIRYLAKLISASTLIFGFIVVFLHPKKLSIHDLMVGSSVIFKKED